MFRASPQHDKSINCHCESSPCHSEGANATEESQQVKRDVSLAMQAQHDNLSCHSEEARSATEESHNIESQHTNP
ncbi:hypothetical protein CQA66_09010 [Helicobacter aurati]|uniref:Uncharacterized protein n=2 Tax=Helicobacter aurati TaxID=137778 RepID=A0A3D8IXJ3_9HELI|nr:hypothetical protein CQA66_09010 [Helicobacter aurati]